MSMDRQQKPCVFSPHQRIVRAARQRHGLRLSAAEVRQLAADDAIVQAAAMDDGNDRGRLPVASVPECADGAVCRPPKADTIRDALERTVRSTKKTEIAHWLSLLQMCPPPLTKLSPASLQKSDLVEMADRLAREPKEGTDHE